MSSMLCLSEEKVKELQQALKHTSNGREVLRIIIILLCHHFSIDILIAILGLSRSCIYDRIARFHHKEMDSFADASRPGRPKLITSEHMKEVTMFLETTPEIWSCQRLASKFDLKVSAETMRRHLRRLKYVFKRPKHVAPASPDPEKEFKLAEIEAVKASLKPDDLLLYADESDFNLLSELRKCWQKKGTQKSIPTPGKNQKVYAFGAIDASRQHFVYRLFNRKRTPEFMLFLRQVVQRFPERKIFMILDNYNVHKTLAVAGFLDANPRLKLLFLPTYSPEENQPIERVWGTVKSWSTANQSFQNEEELMSAVKSGLSRFQHHLKTDKQTQ